MTVGRAPPGCRMRTWCGVGRHLFAAATVQLVRCAVGSERSSSTWLFVDEGLVPKASRGNFEPVVPPAVKDPRNPVMVEDRVWEVRWDNTYPTTLYDPRMQKFRMWYGSCLSCDRPVKPGDSKPNTVFGCGHPTWHQQFPGQTPWQTPPSALSGVLYAESVDGVNWVKPPLSLVAYGAPPPPPPACVVGSLGGGDLHRANMTVVAATAWCSNSSACAGFTAAVGKCPASSQVLDIVFKDAYGNARLNPRNERWRAWRSVPRGTGGVVNVTNIVAAHTGGTGVIWDVREANASRRFKLFGGMSFHLCQNRPASNVAVDGTAWPPCHLTGIDYSADGIRWEHSQNESLIPPTQYFDKIGQNDGTLDVAIYDEHLGQWWGLVRVDAGFVGRPGNANANPRRTGRFTSSDMKTFTPAVQVFNGTADYQIYMVLPFRLPDWPPGYYLATASFLLFNQTVRTELLQSRNFGVNWTQIAPGSQFIPLGPPGDFDSFTTYTSWSGSSAPLLDPRDPNRTLFFGGDGPHDGQRDDSIGLATVTTNAYAGLAAGEGRHRIRTTLLKNHNCNCQQEWHVLAALGSNAPSNATLRVRHVTFEPDYTQWPFAELANQVADEAFAWYQLPFSDRESRCDSASVSWEFECYGGCTLFALRQVHTC